MSRCSTVTARVAGVLAVVLTALAALSATQASAATLYWAGNSNIGLQELDDATGATTGPRNDSGSSACVRNWSWGANSTMYYGPLASTSSSICQMRLDGTGSSSTLVDTQCGGLGVGAIYATDQYVFWACMNTSRVGRVDVDGANVNRTFISTPAGPDDNYTLAMAANQDWLYLGNAGVYSCMKRYHIDGSGVDPGFSVCGGDIRGLDVDGRYVYWAANGGQYIGRAKANGSSINATWLSSGTGTFGVTVTGSAIYWTRTNGSIGRAALDGTGANSSWTTGASINSSNEHAQLHVVGGAAKLLPIPPPVNTVLPAVGAAAQVGVPVSVDSGTWTNPPASAGGYAYQWEVSANGADGWANAAGTGAATATYTPAAAEYAKFLRARVTATNDGDSTIVYSATTSAVLPIAPVSSVAPLVSGTVQVDQTLTVDSGAWTSQQQPTGYAYAWESSADGSTWEAALGEGADSAEYDVDLSDDGKYLRVRVTATNDGGATAAYSTSLGPVDILAPTSSAVPEISGTAEIGSTLTASSGTWDFATDYAYAWQTSADGSTWEAASGSGASTSAYTVVAADAGRYLRVRVTGSNRVGELAVASEASTRVPSPVSPVSTPTTETPAPVFSPAPGISVGETRGEAVLAAAVPAAGADLLRGAKIWVRPTSKTEFVAESLPDGLKLVDGKLVATKPGAYTVKIKVKRANGTTVMRKIKIKVG